MGALVSYESLHLFPLREKERKTRECMYATIPSEDSMVSKSKAQTDLTEEHTAALPGCRHTLPAGWCFQSGRVALQVHMCVCPYICSLCVHVDLFGK